MSFDTSFSDITGSIGSLFGGTDVQSGTTQQVEDVDTTTTGTQRERLKIDDAAIQKIIEDVLGGAEGLADIFAGEQSAGIFDSSVAAEAAGDLATKLAGEIAKLTAEKETTQEQRQETRRVGTGTTKKEAEDEGIISGIGDFFGF